MTTYIAAVDTRLADKHPSIVHLTHRHAEQTRECVALSEARLLGHRCIGLIILLIAGLGTLPPRHRSDLRTEERAGSFREVKRRHLATNHATLGILPWTGYLITEGDIIVPYSEFNRHLLTLSILKRDFIDLARKVKLPVFPN